MSTVLADRVVWVMDLLGVGTRGERRDGVNVALFTRAGQEFRWPFLKGMVGVNEVERTLQKRRGQLMVQLMRGADVCRAAVLLVWESCRSEYLC